MTQRYSRLAVMLALALLSPAAVAADLSEGNTAWILTSTALVLFMTIPGLSLFYGGLVRVKNVLSVLMQCFAITCLVSILWLFGVYSLAFGEGNAVIGDLSNFMMRGVQESTMSGDIPESVFAMFQLTFAIITPALIVGGFAERMRFSSMLLFSGLWLVLVYAPVTHWVWGGGWLGQMGLLDFAGGTVVHVTAGVAALVCALVMGPRSGFPQTPMPPHNMTMAITGAGMLWVGWFGFNAGSALAANGDAGMAMLATHMSASAGAFTWMMCEWVRYGKPSALGAVTGMVAGLGTITPASGFVGPSSVSPAASSVSTPPTISSVHWASMTRWMSSRFTGSAVRSARSSRVCSQARASAYSAVRATTKAWPWGRSLVSRCSAYLQPAPMQPR